MWRKIFAVFSEFCNFSDRKVLKWKFSQIFHRKPQIPTLATAWHPQQVINLQCIQMNVPDEAAEILNESMETPQQVTRGAYTRKHVKTQRAEINIWWNYALLFNATRLVSGNGVTIMRRVVQFVGPNEIFGTQTVKFSLIINKLDYSNFHAWAASARNWKCGHGTI